MKRIGLLGGMSWESSAQYYRLVNEAVRARRGGLHSADCVLRSVDFAEIEALQASGRWDDAGALLAAEAQALVAAGAELLVLCTNTMHKVAGAITAAVPDVPFVHIADTTAHALQQAGHHRVGLLATAYTMEQDFYVGRLRDHGLGVLVPGDDDRALVHEVIYDELCLGVIRPESRAAYREVIAGLVEQGASAVILGCTEIGLLIGPDDASVPLFDTTHLHARRAVELALAP